MAKTNSTFKFGKMNDPKVYLDETILRQTKNFKNIFFRLAESLVYEGKKDIAVKALDFCQSMMPKETVPLDVFSVRMVEGYYVSDAKDKGAKLLKEIFEFHTEKARYFMSFKKGNKLKSVQSDIEENMQIAGYCAQLAEIHKDEKLAKEFQAELTKLQAGS